MNLSAQLLVGELPIMYIGAMSTIFKINGDTVPREECEALRQDLPTSPKTEQSLLDNTLTETELNYILDANGNGRISQTDFDGWSLNCFENVEQILSRHRFNIPEKILKNSPKRIFLSEMFRSCRAFILAIIKQNGRLFILADQKFRADREIVFAAAKNWCHALQLADPSLKNDIPFLTQLALVNIGVLESIRDPVLQNAVWQSLRGLHDWSSLLPEENFQTYDSWKEGLKKIYNIEFVQRFRSHEVLYSVVSLRHHLQHNPSKPLAVVHYPKKDDWLDESFAEYPTMDQLTELGYQVFYYEDATEGEVLRDLAQATQNGGQKADLIVLAGHGTATAISLGAENLGPEDNYMKDETLFIDTGDFKKDPPDIPLSQYIKSVGDIILNSCSNGEGRETNPHNLANTIARLLPKGVTLHASDQPMNIHDISRDQNGKLIMTWDQDSLYTTNGKKE